MIDSLISYFEQYTSLTALEKEALIEQIPVERVSKQTLLLSEGEISQKFYFLIQGCVRLYYQVELEEKTAFFYMENMFISSYESFTQQVPAKHSLQTLEDSTLAVISIEAAAQLVAVSSTFDTLARIMMEQELMVCQEIISSFVTQNAEQRYATLLEHKSELLNRIPQYQLATFLGVSPETLSRIRKRISKKSLS